MQFRTIVAAFFLRGHAGDIASLARAAGMTEFRTLDVDERIALGFHEAERIVLAGQWEAFGDAWAILDTLGESDCLQIYAAMDTWIDADLAADAAVETQGDLAFACTFRDACIELDPVAAFLDTRSHYGDARWENKQGNRDWVLAQGARVVASNANGLADERYGLLFLGDALASRWSSDEVRDDRDAIEVPRGRLVFAGSGRSRMA